MADKLFFESFAQALDKYNYVMKKLPFVLIAFSMGVSAQSVFLPENGKYIYRIDDISQRVNSYVTLKSRTNELYKLDGRRNEFIVKNWFQHDWFLMQNNFSFDMHSYIQEQKASTFNE